jgi:outer membrane protein
MSLARGFLATSLLALLLSAPAFGQEAESWIVKVGAHDVDPKSGNGRLAGGALGVDVDDSVRPTATLERLFTPHLGLEIIAAWPFEHEVSLNGAPAAKVKQLPPTLSLQYHFAPAATISPFVGVGLNYTRFFSIEERGPLQGARLSLGDSWGLAAHAGVDFRLGERWLAGVDVRWIDIDTRVRVNGVAVGTVAIDPLVAGAYVGYRL